MTILLFILSLIPAVYVNVFYLLLPLIRKKAVAITPKLILTISISLIIISITNFQNLFSVVVITILLLLSLAAYLVNIWIIINSSGEKIIQSINKVCIGMNLKYDQSASSIFIGELNLKINNSDYKFINILKLHSDSKSAKLKLFQTVVKKFITA